VQFSTSLPQRHLNSIALQCDKNWKCPVGQKIQMCLFFCSHLKGGTLTIIFCKKSVIFVTWNVFHAWVKMWISWRLLSCWMWHCTVWLRGRCSSKVRLIPKASSLLIDTVRNSVSQNFFYYYPWQETGILTHIYHSGGQVQNVISILQLRLSCHEIILCT